MKNYKLIALISLFIAILGLSIAFIAYSKVMIIQNNNIIKGQINEKNHL